jgi:hypothetical protein
MSKELPWLKATRSKDWTRTVSMFWSFRGNRKVLLALQSVQIYGARSRTCHVWLPSDNLPSKQRKRFAFEGEMTGYTSVRVSIDGGWIADLPKLATRTVSNYGDGGLSRTASNLR